jgi:hypothetical protein
MKSIKEKKLLVNFARSMGQEVDADLIEEVETYNIIKDSVQQSVKKNIFSDLAKALKDDNAKPKVEPIQYPLPPSLDDLLTVLNEGIEKENNNELVQEKTETERASENPTPSFESDNRKIIEGNETPSNPTRDSGPQPGTQTLADVTAKFISESPKTSYQQPDPLVVSDNMDAIRGKLKFLEQWIAKVSMAGPGGGAGSVAKLDHETKVVTTNNYSVTTKDYYIGINYAGPVTISLPTIINDGKMYIIKDESGRCSSNPITVQGTVDNDTGGFILAQDNGGIQLIYRNGWRIV